MTDRLRDLWDFGDLVGTEQRFRDRLDAEITDGGRSEVLTQLARVEGLRSEFGRGEQYLEQAAAVAGTNRSALVRIDLERGRLRRSSGDGEAALPLFVSAFQKAVDAAEHFLAVDAAHMAALVAPDRDAFLTWTQRGIELAEAHPDAGHWLGPLLNNLGWEYYEAAEFEAALDAFDRALSVRLSHPDKPEPIAIARYAVGKALRSLGRADEAILMVGEAVAWADSAGQPDGWFHEELAEDFAAVGRLQEAAKEASLALSLLPAADPGFGEDTARVRRLHFLAGGAETAE